MKISRLTICIFFLLGGITLSSAQEWQKIGSDHFLIYFTREESFAKEVTRNAEDYYRHIAADLRYQRYSEFWTWDNRVKIYIYPDRNSYLNASGMPNWSAGMADYTNKQILSYAHSQGFIDGVLPHEIAHLIFRDFVGFKGEVPLWLDEGVAQWAEIPKRELVKSASKNLFNKNALFSISDMVSLDIRQVSGNSTVQVHSLSSSNGERKNLTLKGDEAVNTYYIEAASLVGFLIERYGADSFIFFCRQLRDGKRLEEALRFVYSTHIATLEELENSWIAYLKS